MNPDRLRMIPEAVAFVETFRRWRQAHRGHLPRPWTLIEADAVRGRTMTSWPSLKNDLSNAGAYWVDAQAVRDKNFVTSRKPDDIPAFSREMIRLFMEAAGAKPSRKTA
jgi:protease I